MFTEGLVCIWTLTVERRPLRRRCCAFGAGAAPSAPVPRLRRWCWCRAFGAGAAPSAPMPHSLATVTQVPGTYMLATSEGQLFCFLNRFLGNRNRMWIIHTSSRYTKSTHYSMSMFSHNGHQPMVVPWAFLLVTSKLSRTLPDDTADSA